MARSVRVLSAFLALVVLAGSSLACGAEDEGPYSVSADALTEAARVTFPGDDGGPPLGEVRAVLFGPGDTLVVVNATAPFLHLYRRDGAFLTAGGSEGEGPGELRDPDFATLLGDTIHVADYPRFVSWSVGLLRELDRSQLGRGILAVLSGCEGRLTLVYIGTDPEGTGERAFGVWVLGGDGWRDLSELGPLESSLVLRPRDFRPVHRNGGVYLNNWASGHIERHDCDTGEVSTIPLPVPEEWQATMDRGMAEIGGELWSAMAPAIQSDTTRLVTIRNDSVTAVADLHADVRLHPGPDSLVALVHYTPVPRIRLYHADSLRALVRP